MPDDLPNAKPAATTVLSVRLGAEERAVLEAAAEQAHTTLSDYVRRRAIVAAEIDVMSNPIVTIPAADWEKFEAWVKEPPKENPALRALFARRPTWEE